MAHEQTTPDDLLNAQGSLKSPGWARRPLWRYHREAVRASRLRLKEWDYYFVSDGHHGLAATVADNGYLGFVSTTWFDFDAPREVSLSVMLPFPLGRLGLPSSSLAGDVRFEHRDLSISVHREPGLRALSVRAPALQGRPLQADLVLTPNESDESMTIATPFPRAPRAFYYNQKINNQPATGTVVWGEETHRYDDAWGVLDWGRGVWTYDNTWYWGSASGRVDGSPFGFNIGYGFGDTSAATENVLFWKGRVHKLDAVQFHIPDDYLKPWTFSSNNGRFELTFRPVLDRASCTDLLVLKSDQHQVFGHFSGRVILDDGATLTLSEFFGFAEKVVNRW